MWRTAATDPTCYHPRVSMPADSPSSSNSTRSARPTTTVARTVRTIIATAGIVLAFDQVSKAMVVDALGSHADRHHVDLLGRHIGLEYVENTGAAFGLLAGNPWVVTVLAAVVAICFLAVFARHLPESRLLQVSLGAVLAGGAGNVIDRVRLGYVIDFLAVAVWPRFNVADSAITLGLGGMIWWLLSNSMEEAHD